MTTTRPPDPPVTLADLSVPEAPYETRRAHLHLAREAGYGRISSFSVAAGVLAAVGVVTVAAGIGAMVLAAAGVDADSLSRDEWKQAGTVGAIVAVLVVMLAWGFGGYVAGRMARRAGAGHGLFVAAWGAVFLALATLVAWAQDGGAVIADRLAELGAPTTADEWLSTGLVAGAAMLVLMVAAAVYGARRGEQWHQRLVTRAFDPEVGPEAGRQPGGPVDAPDEARPAEPAPAEPGPGEPRQVRPSALSARPSSG